MLNSPDAIVATIPLIATKLTVPRRRPDPISRRRLIERLNLGVERKLTLVSAPAGFGKTTVLAEWLAALQALDRRIAWVSLDRRDNDPTRFWDYILAALQASGSAAGNRARAMLHTAQSPIEAVLAALVNDLGAEAHPTALILDDLHAIEDEAIHQAVAYLLDHLPPHLHLVVASRVDPPLPLAGLRARGESTELRAADLKFTLDEAVAFLNEAMRLKLSMADVAALEQRTEGWIAGLQLAALSMQGRDDSGAFIAAFAGDDRYIVDYLVEEVLQRQPAEVRQFLLETSILDRLNGPLCDAVTGRSDGRAMLERLERTNLFVVPLDDKRHWYRYHHLFADVLRVHVTGGEPERLPGLHQRAAAWFERQGDVPEAIEHARAAVDHETVARLLAAHVDEFERTGHFASLMSWVASLPDELVRARPKLALIHAACSVRTDPNLVVARERLSWAETAISHIESGDAGSGAEELAGLKGELLALELQVRRDLTPDEMMETALRALDLLPPNKHHLRGMMRMIHAGMQMDCHDLNATLASLELAVEEVRRSDNPLILSCLLEMRGQTEVVAGRLAEARRSFEEALTAARLASIEADWTMCGPHARLAEVLLEQGELEGALDHVAKVVELADKALKRSFVLIGRLVAARVLLAAGDADGALAQLREAEGFARGVTSFRYGALLAAGQIELFCRLGDHAAAVEIARERGLTSEAAIGEDNGDELLAYARLLLASGDTDGAARLLTRIVADARERGHRHREIRALAQLALAFERLGKRTLALDTLARATTLGEPGRYIATFTGEGPAMSALLRDVQAGQRAAVSGSAAYLTLLRHQLDGGAVVAEPDGVDGLPEPLTARELEVLRLIAAGMRNNEIADRLYISLPTVKRHIANAYGKLGVGHRTAAIARASELNLL